MMRDRAFDDVKALVAQKYRKEPVKTVETDQVLDTFPPKPLRSAAGISDAVVEKSISNAVGHTARYTANPVVVAFCAYTEYTIVLRKQIKYRRYIGRVVL